MQQVEGHFDGMGAKQKKAALATLGFKDKTQGTMLQLMGTSEKIREYQKQLDSAAGTTETIARKQMGSLINQLKLTKNAFSEVAISIGTGFL